MDYPNTILYVDRSIWQCHRVRCSSNHDEHILLMAMLTPTHPDHVNANLDSSRGVDPSSFEGIDTRCSEGVDMMSSDGVNAMLTQTAAKLVCVLVLN
jgi:hypothetical protein